jgi:hypothetical protein
MNYIIIYLFQKKVCAQMILSYPSQLTSHTQTNLYVKAQVSFT